MTDKHTPGPWRWEINQKNKNINLCGGVPAFDLTVMGFSRWGMSGAAPRFRDENCVLQRADNPNWLQSHHHRNHHFEWCADINHPDARLIAAAPDLLAALEDCLSWHDFSDDLTKPIEVRAPYMRARSAIAKAKGTQQ